MKDLWQRTYAITNKYFLYPFRLNIRSSRDEGEMLDFDPSEKALYLSFLEEVQ